MTNDDRAKAEITEHKPRTLRLPGFLVDDDEIGLGDLIKKATSAMGIKPCAGCEERAASLNKWVHVSR